jgi:DNA-binding protein Fis
MCFKSFISINGYVTSFIDLLRNTININIKSRHSGQENNNLYNLVSEDERYKSTVIKLIQGLNMRGNIEHVERGLYDKVMEYIEINKRKVTDEG